MARTVVATTPSRASEWRWAAATSLLTTASSSQLSLLFLLLISATAVVSASSSSSAATTPTSTTTASSAAVPLKFRPAFHGYDGRFFVAEDSTQGVEFTSELDTPVSFDAASMASAHPPVVVQVDKMLGTFDYVELEHQHMKCDAFRNLSSVAQAACFTPLTCTWSYGDATGHATTSFTNQTELVLKGGPNASSQGPTCGGGEWIFSAMMLVDARIATVPNYYYGVLVDSHDHPTLTSVEATAAAQASWGTAGSRDRVHVHHVEHGFHMYGGGVHDAHVVRYLDGSHATVDHSASHLSQAKGLTAVCDVFDTSGMILRNGMGVGHALGCPECEHVADMYRVCNADEECAGFTTTLETEHGVTKEVPLFLHYGSHAVNARAEYHGSSELLFYEKQQESARTCRFVFDVAGRAQVFFLQSYFTSGTASIFVGDEFVKECGKSSKFIGDGQHVHGYDHSCHTYMLCHEMDVWEGEEVRVVSSAHMRQGGCKESLGVIVNVSEIAPHPTPHVTEPRVTPAPIEQTRFTVQRHIWAAPTNDEYTVVKLYGIHVRDLALQVYQTGWDCSGDQGCHNTTIDVTRYTGARRRQDAIHVQSCGGGQGFYEDAGHSDQCHKKLWCSSVAPLTDFSGFIEIKYRPRDLLFRSHECNFFRAELFGVAERHAEAFLLVDHDDFLASPLVAVPLGSNRTVASYVSTAFAHAPLALPIEVGTFAHPFGTYYVDYNSHEPKPSEMQGNVSFACVVDHIGVSAVRCLVAVPATATKVHIDVAQTDFHVNEFTWELERHGKIKKHTCGGPVHGFHGRKGRSDLCHTYLACADEYMYASVSDTRWEHVAIHVPRSVTSGACNFSFVGVVHFTEVPIPQVSAETCHHGEGFVCEADRTCLIHTAVCDDINDCTDGADEAPCTNWRLTELEKRFSFPGHEHVLHNITTLAECRRDAVLNETVAFAYREAHEECILFEGAYARLGLAAPSRYLIAQEDVEFFTHIEDVDEYNKCSSVLHCHHHGELTHEAELQDGDACFCHCHKQYTEHDCSLLKTLDSRHEMVAVFRKPAVDVHASLGAMARGILHDNHEVRITPQAFEYFNATHESMGFHVSSLYEPGADAHFTEELFDAAVLTKVNHLLEEAVQPHIDFFTTRTPMSLFEALPNCREIGTETAFACANTSFHVRALRVSGVSVATMQIDATFSGHSRRRAGGAGTLHVEHYFCNDSNTVNTTAGQCVTSTCVVYIDDTLVGIAVTATPAAQTRSGCHVHRGLVVEGQHAIDLPPNESHDAVEVVDPRKDEMFVLPAFAVLASFICLGVAGYFTIRHQQLLDAEVSAMASVVGAEAEGSAGHEVVLARLEEAVIEAHGDSAQRAVTLVIAWMLLLFGSVFLILMHQTANDRESNFEIIAEHYRDPACANSSTAFIPYRVSRIHADLTCHRLAAEGDADHSIAAKGNCVMLDDGHHGVQVGMHHGVDQCEHTDMVTVVSGTCVDLETIFGASMAGTGYTLLECLPIAMGEARFNAFVGMTAIAEETEHLTSVPPPESMRPYTRVLDGETIYFRPFSFAGHREVASSAHAARLETMYDNTLFYGNYDGRRLILHTQHEWRDGTNARTATAAVEKANLEHLQDLSSTVLALAPNHKDYPLGEIFNHWEEPGELAGHAAGPNAHRYYYMQDTAFDVGSQYGPTADHDVPGEGFTFQAWVRASEDTHGFAYALVDGVEHRKTGHSIVLDRLLTLLDSGHGEWFESQWHVYASLYLDGGSGAVHFIFADPLDELADGSGGCEHGGCNSHGGNATTTTTPHREPVQPGLRKAGQAVVDVKWDMHQIGMMRVFNGLWHRLSVVMRNENGKTDVRIFVDSQTSMLDEGWTKCVPRRPSPIARVHHAVVEDVAEETVFDGGVMYVGYMNGGVHAVEFDNHPLSKDEATLTSSDEVRAHLSLKDEQHRILAGVMFGMALVGFVLLFLPVRQMLAERAEDAAGAEQEALVLYAAMSLFQIEGPTPEGGAEAEVYAIAPFVLARRWLELEGDSELMLEVLNELVASGSEDHPVEELLVKCLWRVYQHHHDHGADAAATTAKVEDEAQRAGGAELPMPDIAEWNGLVARETEAFAAESGAGGDTEMGAAKTTEASIDPPISVLGTAYAVTEPATILIKRAMRSANARVVVEHGRLCFDQAVEAAGRVDDDVGEVEHEGDAGLVEDLVGAEAEAQGEAAHDEVNNGGTDADDEDADADADGDAEGGGGEGEGEASGGDAEVGGADGGIDLAAADATIPVASGQRGGGTYLPSAGEILAPVLHVVQTMALYTTAVVLPRLYVRTYGVAFNFLALDLAVALDAPTLVTPILQFVVGVLVFIALIYAAATDHRAFRNTAADYVQHRDEKEGPGAAVKARAAARAAAFPEEAEATAPYRYEMRLMHPSDRGAVDHLVAKKEDSATGSGSRPEVVVAGCTVQKAGGGGGGEAVVAGSQEPLAKLDGMCAEHPEVVLIATVQNNIVPYQNRRACCAFENGERCGRMIGTLYHCGLEVDAGGGDGAEEEQEGYSCDYALCEAHYRPTMAEKAKSALRTAKEDMKQSGAGAIFTALVVAVTAMLYMPFVKTACMIVICHPFYQCEFEHCWQSADQKFALAAYMAVFFLLIFGVGIPGLEVTVLATRLRTLLPMFRGTEYAGAYLDGDGDNAANEDANQPTTSPAAGGADMDGSGEVKRAEWMRFLSADETQLASLYGSFTMRWIYMAPLLLFFKLLLLLPVVFAEPESMVQLACIAAAEGVYFVFVFATDPYMSPVTALTVRVGSVHQLVVVGLVSLHMVEVFHGNREGHTTGMMAASSAYLLFVVVELVLLQAVPVVLKKRRDAKLAATLERVGVLPSRSASLYLVPTGEAVVRTAVETEAGGREPIQDDGSGGGAEVAAGPKRAAGESDDGYESTPVSVDASASSEAQGGGHRARNPIAAADDGCAAPYGTGTPGECSALDEL